jgi:hypothetical protein
MNPKKLTPLLYLAAAGAIAVSAVALLERSEFLGQANASSYTMTLDKSSLNYFPSVSLGDLTASCTFPTALGNPIGFNFSTSGYASSRGFFAGIGGGKNPTYMKNTTPIHGITSVYLEIIKYDYSDDDTLPPTITFSDYADFSSSSTYTGTIVAKNEAAATPVGTSFSYNYLRTEIGWGNNTNATYGDNADVYSATISFSDPAISYFRIDYINTTHRWFVLTMTLSFSCQDVLPSVASSSGEAVTAATGGEVPATPISSLPGISIPGGIDSI